MVFRFTHERICSSFPYLDCAKLQMQSVLLSVLVSETDFACLYELFATIFHILILRVRNKCYNIIEANKHFILQINSGHIGANF